MDAIVLVTAQKDASSIEQEAVAVSHKFAKPEGFREFMILGIILFSLSFQ